MKCENADQLKQFINDVIEDNLTVKSLKGDVSTLKGDVTVLKEDVNVLKEDVKILKEDMGEIKESVRRIGILQEDMNAKMTLVLEIIAGPIKKTEEIPAIKENLRNHEVRISAIEHNVKKNRSSEREDNT